MHLRSFCLVGTGNLSKEVATCIFAIRRLYNLPIYIVGDDDLIEYLKDFDFENVFINNWANQDKLDKIDVSDVKTPVGTYHNKQIIYLKFDALDWAIREAGNTLFIDSDIIIKDYIHDSINVNQDVILSPSYWIQERNRMSNEWGAFNAGYLYARDGNVGQVWRDIYFNHSSFYEQQGMHNFFNHFDCCVFTRQHNFGFWRFTYKREKVLGDNKITIVDIDKINLDFVKSFHIRLGYFDYENSFLLKRAEAFRNAVLPYIPKTILDFHQKL